MGRRRPRNIEKAAPRQLAPAATFTAEQVAALANAMNSNSTAPATPLPRLDPMVPFGPGRPLIPATIDPVREDTGRPEPRIYEYPVTINLPGMTDRLVPWKVLRDASEIPVVRDCIRIRKNEVSSLEWDIVVSKRAAQAMRRTDPGMSSVQVERAMRDRLAPEVDRLMTFWQQPDWQQGENFVAWVTKLLEEHLVLDAAVIYPFRNRGGDRPGLRILDASTIKVLADHLGGRPAPPSPAYQQILWGFPRGEYTADVDPDSGSVINGYDSDRLIYRRKEVRTITPYGFSAVEQALQDVDLYLRRMEWDKAQYTDGVQPAGWIKNLGVESWTPQQLQEYSRAFNDLYAGQTMQRMRYQLLPPGLEPMDTVDIPEKYKPDYHLHLIKLVAMHFDVTLAELGFTEAKGLGGASYHEGQENVQHRKGTNPTLVWLQSLITEISRIHLGMPPELEFKFLGLDAEDQAAADEVLDKQLKDGRITWNEAREEMGRAPYDFDEANMPAIQMNRGVVFLEGASQLAPPGRQIEAPGPLKASEETAGAVPGDAKKTELAQYWKWHRNGHSTNRRFAVKHLTAGDLEAQGIDPATVTKAGRSGPKAPAGLVWPAWEKDQETAAYWAGRISQAFAGINLRRIAELWVQARKGAGFHLVESGGMHGSPNLTVLRTAPDLTKASDAEIWLASLNVTVTNELGVVLEGVYTDGYYLGTVSAEHAIATLQGAAAAKVDWGQWQPGNSAAARAVAGDGLQQLLQQADVTIKSVAGNRMHELADRLAVGLDNGDSVDTIADSLSDVLTDARWASLVAVTETSRAVTFASQQTYMANGVRQNSWMAASSACQLCLRNEEASAVPVGANFPSGVAGPPAHPACRCSAAPVIDVDDFRIH